MPSYLFALGNSTVGPIGFDTRIQAASEAEALAKLRQSLSAAFGAEGEEKPIELEVEGLEYLTIFINPSSAAFQIAAIENIEPDPDDELFDKKICPRCGEYGDTTTIEDHGHCRDCHAQWQHGILDDRDDLAEECSDSAQEDEDNHGSPH